MKKYLQILVCLLVCVFAFGQLSADSVFENRSIASTVYVDTTVTLCFDGSYMFAGQQLTEPGVYIDTLPRAMGGDSIVTLTLVQGEELIVEIDREFTACANDGEHLLPFVVKSGTSAGYQILYSDKAKEAGFVNSEVMPITSSPARIVMPEHVVSNVSGETKYVEPGYYPVQIVFFNECHNERVMINMLVEYPEFVIAQRWNDVLALKNEYFNGGYEFSKFQWYKTNDENVFYPIENEDHSMLYVRGGNLDFNAEYKLLLTRADDNSMYFTCSMRPEKYATDKLPDVCFAASSVITSTAPGRATIITLTGRQLATFDICVGENSLPIELPAAVYVLNVRYDDGQSENIKIVVR